MVKRFWKTVSIVGLFIATLVHIVSQAHASTPLSITFDALPNGAALSINDKPMGNTPLTLQLDPGIYSVHVSLPGFADWVGNQVIDGTTDAISIELQPGPDLIRLNEEPIFPSWANTVNQLRFVSDKSKGVYTDYDLDSGKISIGEHQHPIGFLEDSVIRQRLNIPDPNSKQIFSFAYVSPSGRYIGYVPHADTPILVIYDTQTAQNIMTNVGISPYVDALYPPFQLIWSQDEQTIWVAQYPPGLNFVHLDGDKAQTISLFQSTTETGDLIVIDRVVGRPSNQQFALVKGAPEGKTYQLWLVNLMTRKALPVPLDGVFDATFSPDGNTIYVAHKGGISRLSADLKHVDLVSDVLSARWGVFEVTLSPTLNYALVTSGGTEAPTYWLYKLPPTNSLDK